MLALVILISSSQAQEPVHAADGFWDHWADGQAEIATYDLIQPRYGGNRKGTAVLITVTETFTDAQRVKSDGGHDDEYPVVKLNEVRDFQTGVYDYNAMTSTFVPLSGQRSWGQPVKITTSVQEWCGHVWEQANVNSSSMEWQLRSYFDGEADQEGSRPVPEGAVFADAMPLVARGMTQGGLKAGESRQHPWFPSLLQRRLSHDRGDFVTATISRSAEHQAQGPTGPVAAYTVTATVGGESSTWTIAAAQPNQLLGWERSSGEKATLRAVQRMKYWELNGVGDEQHLEKLKLSPR
jgi:hypothetical protein